MFPSKLSLIFGLTFLSLACSGRTVDTTDSGSEDTNNSTTASDSQDSADNSTFDTGGTVPTVSEAATGTDDTTATEASSSEETGDDSCDYCDIWEPGVCGEGRKCTLVSCEEGSSSWDQWACRDIQGDAGLGDECTFVDGDPLQGNDTCGDHMICWNPDPDTSIGHCNPYCEGSPKDPTCPGGYDCAVTSGVVSLCIEMCNPLEQDCQDPSTVCIPDINGDGYVCLLDASGDMAPYGTPCTYATSCNSGLMCIDAAAVPEAECASASGCCSPFCSISSGTPCPGEGQTCEAIFDPQPPGFEDVGVCAVVQ